MATTAMSNSILLCSFVNPDEDTISEAFDIQYDPSSLVSQVKREIKAQCPNRLKSIDAADLELWKPKQPIFDGDTDRIRKIKFLHPSSENETYETTAEKLRPGSKISAYWSDGLPQQGHVHILVRVPFMEIDAGPPRKRFRRGSNETVGSAQKLGRNEKLRSNHIVFTLYDILWGKPEALTTVTEEKEEHVPSCIGEEPDIKLKARFIDLRDALHWRPDDDVLCPYFLIRDEYEELYDYLRDSSNKTNVLLLGQPGIGKTICLTYFLVKRLVTSQITIFSPSPDNRYLFLPSGVHWIPGKSFSKFTSPDLNIVEDKLALYDLNYEQSNLMRFATFRLLVASSPKEDRYKEWVKQTNAQRYVMKTWSWPEVYHGRKFATWPDGTDEFRTQKLKEGFLKYGGSARNLLTRSYEQIDVLISQAVKQCNDIQELCSTDDTPRDNASHVLVEIGPGVGPDGTIDRWRISSCIASKHIFHLLLKRKRRELARNMAAVFNQLFQHSATRSASGILFEGAGHRYILQRIMSQSLLIKRLGSNARTSVDLQHVKGVVKGVKRLRESEIGLFDEMNSSYYYQPVTPSLAGIDSFVIDKPGSVVAFQFTTATSHLVSPAFFKKLWVSHMRASTMIRWKLIFVVPKEIHQDFMVQRWTTAEADWTERVDQYILPVDVQEIWDKMNRN